MLHWPQILWALPACREIPTTPESHASSTVAVLPDAVVTVLADEGDVIRLRPTDGDVRTLALDGEPTRIARAGSRLLVTDRRQRRVVILDLDLEPVGEVEVGPEPVGVVATTDGRLAYVAVSLADRVVELDLDQFEVTREILVPDEPRWLALDEIGGALWVASARAGRLSRVDLRTEIVQPVSLPAIDPVHPRALRITGDPCLTLDRRTLALPALYADTGAPPPGPGTGEEAGSPVDLAVVSADGGPIDPALLLIETAPPYEGIPVLATTQDGGSRRSALSSATCSPDEHYIVATMDGSDRALVVDRDPFRTQQPDRPLRDGLVSPLEVAGYWERPIGSLTTGKGPRGAAFDGPDSLWIASVRDRRAARYRWEDAVEVVVTAASSPGPGTYPVLDPEISSSLGPSRLSPDAAHGRDLFYSAIDGAITNPEVGISCASCHEDGRTDGLTWWLDDGPRQTPSLAGGLFGTGPYGWGGEHATTGDLIEWTRLRMGGSGPYDRHALELWLESIPPPDLPRDPDDRFAALGERLFHSPEVGCAGCHADDAGTDRQLHEVYGSLVADTPRLVGLAATAPYMHDGGLATLEDVVDYAAGGQMGDTSTLDADQRYALLEYLRTR